MASITELAKQSVSVEDMYAALNTSAQVIRNTEDLRGKGDAIATHSFKLEDLKIHTPRDWVGEYIASVNKEVKVVNKNDFKRDFDQNTWTIELPGIERERIEVFKVKNAVYVRVDEKEIGKQYLDEGETIKSTKLDLGILTVIIDRPNKRETIEIG